MARDWPAAPRPRPRPPSRRLRTRTLLCTLLYFASKTVFTFALDSDYSSERSSSPAASPPRPLSADAAELVRDAPLYPPLQHTPFDAYEDIYELDTIAESKTTLQDPEIYKDDDTETQPAIDPKVFELASNIEDKIAVEQIPEVYEELETSIEDNRLVDEVTVETDDATNVQNDEERVKRSSGKEWEKPAKSVGLGERRVKTGDTILNIRGAVRDAIGDAGAAGNVPSAGPGRAGTGAASRLDTFVIRPARPHQPAPPTYDAAHHSLPTQAPRYDRELLVEAHARARIPCDVSNSSDVRWFKDNDPVNAPEGAAGGSGAEGLWRERGGLVVGRATRGDAGYWRCVATDRNTGKTVSGKPTRLLIYEPVRSVYLAVDGRRLDAGNTWVPVRDKTELEVRCVAEGGVPQPELSWRLIALEPALDHRPYLRIHHTNYSIEGVSLSHAVVTAARELHNATLQCEARQRRPAPSAPPAPPAPVAPQPAAAPVDPLDVVTAKLEIHVTYPPSFVISRWPGFGVSLWAGGAAALRCDVDANPPARAWWLRDDANPTSSPPPLEAGDGTSRGSATLRWAALRAAHAGWYRCRAAWLDTQYSSIGYYLNVISPEENTEPVTPPEPVSEETEHQKVEVPLGGNVQLHCPKGSVGCWWRRGAGNSSAESWAPAGSHHAHGVLGIKEALYQEGGEYRCVGARAPELARVRELKRVTLHVTGGATATALSASPAGGGWRLECGACGRGVRVLWLRGVGGAGGAGAGAMGSLTAMPAPLAPDLPQHCWRAALHVTEPDEVWCVAATPTGGAVAVFPPRARPAPSPAPARHTVTHTRNHARTHLNTLPLLLLSLLIDRLQV